MSIPCKSINRLFSKKTGIVVVWSSLSIIPCSQQFSSVSCVSVTWCLSIPVWCCFLVLLFLYFAFLRLCLLVFSIICLQLSPAWHPCIPNLSAYNFTQYRLWISQYDCLLYIHSQYDLYANVNIHPGLASCTLASFCLYMLNNTGDSELPWGRHNIQAVVVMSWFPSGCDVLVSQWLWCSCFPVVAMSLFPSGCHVLASQWLWCACFPVVLMSLFPNRMPQFSPSV